VLHVRKDTLRVPQRFDDIGRHGDELRLPSRAARARVHHGRRRRHYFGARRYLPGYMRAQGFVVVHGHPAAERVGAVDVPIAVRLPELARRKGAQNSRERFLLCSARLLRGGEETPIGRPPGGLDAERE